MGTKIIARILKIIKENEKIRGFLIFFIIFIILNFVFGFLLYYGFFFGVPSSATYLTNYNNLDNTLTWDYFKTNHTQVDPSKLTSSSNYWVQVSEVDWKESISRPHDNFSFKVSYGTSNSILTQPSLLVLLLDQNDRIRGKLYAIQSSDDFKINGNNQSQVTFWFKVPEDMQNQPISVVVEVWGLTTPNNQNSYSTTITHQSYYDTIDNVYGSIPAPASQYNPQGFVNINFLAYSRVSMHTPTNFSILDLVSYSDLLYIFVAALGSTVYWVIGKNETWWSKNKPYAIMAILFLITYLIIAIIVGALM